MVKARKKKARKAAAAGKKKRSVKTVKKTRPRKAPRKAKRRAKKPQQEGLIDSMLGAAEDAAALRLRMVGRESFED